ncbi:MULTISPECIES: LacI family DNA-binding transcriptional regulator [unclassified Mycolicibacterium]|uniref:LacI family DNA-binding transcriptional regulator n=1 Tax=unclassified Mycolicibacterium TaxID=2636767 RepID=UPI002EDBA567
MADAPVTIMDIAREMGLSKTTVSDALVGSGRVSEATRRKTRLVAERMGYVSNRAARSLRRNETGALGLYIPGDVRNLSFYMELAFGAADESAALGLDLTLIGRSLTGDNRARPPQVDGIIVVDPLAGDAALESLFAANRPVVTVGRMLESDTPRTAAEIEIDHYGMATALLSAIREAGGGRPALVALDQKVDSSYVFDVSRAYQQWCSRADVAPLTTRLSATPTDTELAEAIREIVGCPEIDTLVFAAQGLAARSVAVLRSLGFQVGSDFHLGTLVGDPASELNNPDIHAVDLRPREFGHAAVTFLHEIIAGQASVNDRRTHQARLVAAGGQATRAASSTAPEPHR